MTQYEMLIELRTMYHDKDESLNKVRELLTTLRKDAETDAELQEDFENNAETYSWIEDTQTELRIQRDCIELVAQHLFPDMGINFWNERY